MRVSRRVGYAAIAGLLGGLMLLGSSAFASSTDAVQSAVTPFFTDLKNFAVDMIPLVLGVLIVGIGLRFAIGYVRKAR